MADPARTVMSETSDAGCLKRWQIFIFTLLIWLGAANSLSAQTRLDSLLNQLSNTESGEQSAILLDLSRYYFFHDSMALAYDYAIRCAEQSQLEDLLTLGHANNFLGYIYLFWDDYNSAIEAFLKTLGIARDAGDKNLETIALHGLGRAYADVGNLEMAKSTTETGLNLARKLGNTLHIAGLYNNLSVIYTKQKEYRKSLEVLKEYERMSLEIGDNRNVVYALNNQGEQLILLEDFDAALQVLDRARILNDSLQDTQAKAAILGNYGQVYQKQGKWREALSYHEQSLEVSRRAGIRQFSVDSYWNLSDCFAGLGDHAKALEYYKKGTELHDSLINENSQRQLNDLLLRHKMAEEKQAIMILEQKNENQRLWIFLIVLGSLLGITILFLIIRGYRFRIRRHVAEGVQMSELIEKQHRELAGVLMQNSQVKEVLNQIDRSIRDFSDNPGEASDVYLTHLSSIKEKVKHSIDGLDEWESIKLHFEKVHPDFFKKLQEQYPDLTRYDLKQCAYIKMDLGTKDIARILSVSDRAIQTARYRIKKKMKLDVSTDLIQHIQNL